MAVTIVNTNYDGEVLDRILTKAATGNELVQKGLINLVPNVSKKYSIPRLKTSKMLRKRVEQPEDKDSITRKSRWNRRISWLLLLSIHVPLRQSGVRSSPRVIWYSVIFRPIFRM